MEQQSYSPGKAIKYTKRYNNIKNKQQSIKIIDKSKQTALFNDPEFVPEIDLPKDQVIFKKESKGEDEGKINVFSSTDLGTARHILMWDFDGIFNPYRYEILNSFVKANKLDIFVLKTKRGIHLIDFHLFSLTEIQNYQSLLNKLLPSDYPFIKRVKGWDEQLNKRGYDVEFLGCTLRINNPYPKLINRITAKTITRDYSTGHVHLFKLILDQEAFEVEGKPIKTNLHFGSYLKRKN